MKNMAVGTKVIVTPIVAWKAIVEDRKGGEDSVVFKMSIPGIAICVGGRNQVGLCGLVVGVDGDGGGSICGMSMVWVWLMVSVTMRDDAGWVLGGTLFSLKH